MTTPRTVLVTGGNRGIGFAIAEEFVAQGHRVAVTARSGEGPAGALTVRADVTDAASVDAAFSQVEAELGPVEVVVANAGITKDTLLMRMSDEEFDSVVETNLGGAFRVVKRASKGMLKARWGRIVLISSVVGLYGSAGQVNYAASKSGLVGMARSITRELGARGITAGRDSASTGTAAKLYGLHAAGTLAGTNSRAPSRIHTKNHTCAGIRPRTRWRNPSSATMSQLARHDTAAKAGKSSLRPVGIIFSPSFFPAVFRVRGFPRP